MYVSCAGLFAYSGISFAISRRMLEIAKTLVREGSITDLFAYRTCEFYHHYLKGHWEEQYAVDDDLVEQNLRYGQLWEVNNYLGLECDRRLRRGDFRAARRILAKLAEIDDVYGYGFARSNHDGMTAILLLEERDLKHALRAAEQYHEGRHEDALRVLGLGMIGKAQILLGERERGSASLAKAADIDARSGQVSPWHQSTYRVAQLLHDLTAFEEAVPGGRSASRRGWRRTGSRPTGWRGRSPGSSASGAARSAGGRRASRRASAWAPGRSSRAHLRRRGGDCPRTAGR
jgi:hypothetical protein